MSIMETLPLEKKELIEKHLSLVIEANKTTNLTRIDDWDQAMVLHVEDSLCGMEELEKCKEGRFADLGSGAGYPGIPLSIATGRKATLIDARQKKMVIVNDIIEELGIAQQIEVYAGRAELYARTKGKKFTAITARALAKLSVLMELASPLLSKGGRLICYKSELDEEELDHAKSLQKKTGMKLVGSREFVLGDEYKRSIVVFEKAYSPTIALPRQEGQAQKNPL